MGRVSFEVSQIYFLRPHLSHAWRFALCYSYLSLVQVKRKEPYGPDTINFILPYMDKNNRSAMFILGCVQLSVYSLVSVSRGSVRECTGPVDSKAPAQTPAKIPHVFL